LLIYCRLVENVFFLGTGNYPDRIAFQNYKPARHGNGCGKFVGMLQATIAFSDNCFLAYPGSNITGEVQLFDAFNLQAKLMIPAHDSPLG
jgi:hypothetical protein